VTRRRLLPVAALLLAVLAAWVNGLGLRWYAIGFQLLGESADEGDFRYAAGAALATAALLLVAMLVLRVLALPWWLLVVTAVGVGTQLALAATALVEAGQRDAGTNPALERTLGGGFGAAFVAPGSWALLVALVACGVVLVRGRSSQTPRAPQDR
jgi:hypothetical protein